MANHSRVESINTHKNPSQINPITPPSPKAVDAFQKKMSASNTSVTNPISLEINSAEITKTQSKAKKFYDELSQKQHAKILGGIRSEIMSELSKVKASLRINTDEIQNIKLLQSLRELQFLHAKYSPASVISEGLSIVRTIAGKIPNGFGAGIGVMNRVQNVSNYSVSGFIYQDPIDNKYHAGFNAFESNGRGYVFLRIDGY